MEQVQQINTLKTRRFQIAEQLTEAKKEYSKTKSYSLLLLIGKLQGDLILLDDRLKGGNHDN